MYTSTHASNASRNDAFNGIRSGKPGIQAPNLETLFAEAGLALFSAIVEDLGTVNLRQQVTVQVAGEDRDFLLFDWLRELLYRFDTEHLVFARFAVRLSPLGLNGTAWGEPLDPDRHPLGHEVKAITYHHLRLEPTADGWLAEVIVDI